MQMLARLTVTCSLATLIAGCPPLPTAFDSAFVENIATYQAEVEEGIGASIAILVDTSGSMDGTVDGRAKNLIARDALQELVTATGEFVKKRPDFAIKVAVISFASSAWKVLDIAPFAEAELRQALEEIPEPGGGTAIGDAMIEARRELYRGGTFRKYILVVTDGQNTSGPDPEKVAKIIHKKSEGAVQIYFVAFDFDPRQFSFLEETGGEVLAASDAKQLRAALKDIYEGKILAEAVDYGETELPRAPAPDAQP